MEQLNRQNWKSFFLAFIPSAALLTAIMVLTVMAVQPSMPKLKTQMPQVEPEIFRPQAQDSLTVLVIGAQGRQAQEFLLIRFNPRLGQVPVTLLPPQMAIPMEEQQATLADMFAQSGANAVRQGVSDYLGVPVERYAVVDRTAFIRVAESTGTVVFTLPEDIVYTDSKGYRINLPAGERRLDGKDVADIFAYPALRKDELARAKLLGELISAIVNQNLHVAGEGSSSRLFKLAVNLLDTDISFADYEYRREAADFISKLETTVAGNIPPAGNFYEQDNTFSPSPEYLSQIVQYFTDQSE